jgi:hypothetical protein
VFLLEVLLHWEASMCVVPADERVFRDRELDVTAKVVNALFVYGFECGFEPVLVDGFVCVEER